MTMVNIRDRKKLETQARILAAAAELFGERGIEAVTVEEIAARACVGKGTIYNYFVAKEHMVAALLVEIDREVFDRMDRLDISDLSAAEALDAFAWGLLEAKQHHHAFVRAFMSRLIGGTDMSAALVGFQADMDAALASVFTRLAALGRLRSDRSIPELILAFKTLHMGLTSLWVLEGAPFTAARSITRLHTAAFAKGISDV